jgi:hypothetical protein
MVACIDAALAAQNAVDFERGYKKEQAAALAVAKDVAAKHVFRAALIAWQQEKSTGGLGGAVVRGRLLF